MEILNTNTSVNTNSQKSNIANILTTPMFGELKEAAYRVTLENLTTAESNEYCQATFKLLDHNNRLFKRNLFEKDLIFFLSHTRRQLNRENEDINPQEYIQELIDNSTEFTMWITYVNAPTLAGNVRRFQNVHFLEPLQKIDNTDVEVVE